MDKKLTDAEIVKALECCAKAKTNEDCKKLKCPFFDNAIDMCGVLNSEQVLIANALDLINRLQAQNKDLAETVHNLIIEKDALFDKAEELKAEIERLKTNLNVELENFATEYDNRIKAEAYKEFAERLRSKAKKTTITYVSDTSIQEYETGWIEISLKDFDNLLKELVGDSE